jgi:3-isopropylmalate/(R)-2-methylmalate dehydratase small subunit
VTLPDHEVRALLDLAAEQPGITVAVDLEAQTVTCGDLRYAFTIDAFERRRLLEGLDDIGLTLAHEAAITDFEARRPAWMPDLARSGAGS